MKIPTKNNRFRFMEVSSTGRHILSQDSNCSVSTVLFTLFPPTYRQLVITVLCVSLIPLDAIAAVAAVIFRIVANRHISPSQTQARIYLDADICAWLEHNYLQRFRLRVSSLVIFGTKYMIRQQIKWEKKIFVGALWRWRTSTLFTGYSEQTMRREMKWHLFSHRCSWKSKQLGFVEIWPFCRIGVGIALSWPFS